MRRGHRRERGELDREPLGLDARDAVLLADEPRRPSSRRSRSPSRGGATPLSRGTSNAVTSTAGSSSRDSSSNVTCVAKNGSGTTTFRATAFDSTDACGGPLLRHDDRARGPARQRATKTATAPMKSPTADAREHDPRRLPPEHEDGALVRRERVATARRGRRDRREHRGVGGLRLDASASAHRRARTARGSAPRRRARASPRGSSRVVACIRAPKTASITRATSSRDPTFAGAAARSMASAKSFAVR